MADAEAKALIHAADKDGNQGIDFNEFAKFWETLHGESDVSENREASLGNVYRLPLSLGCQGGVLQD